MLSSRGLVQESNVVEKSAHDVPFTKSVRRNWRLIIIEGLILVALGLSAVIVPPTTNFAVTVVLGWLFSVSGFVGLITTLAGRHAPGFWWSLLSALLALAVGIVLIEWRSDSALPLTYLLIFFFVIEGIATIMFAVEHKRQLSGRWEWMTASGIVDLALAALVIAGLPGTANWVVGLLVGINMVFGGSALIAMAVYGHANALR
jgi:uncharacterized membrane protein HdeD (DUF308 family)